MKYKIWRNYIHYKCPACGEPLNSLIQNAGDEDSCPDCDHSYEVPGQAEIVAMQTEKKAAWIQEQQIEEKNYEQNSAIKKTVNASSTNQMDTAEFANCIKKAPALASISFVIFILSMFLPAIDLGIFSIEGYSAAMRSFIWMISGPESAFGLDGLGGMADFESNEDIIKSFWFKTAWILNAVYLVCLYFVFQKKKLKAVRISCLICVAWALFGLLEFPNGSITIEAEIWGIGYWLWTLSFLLLFISIFSCIPTDGSTSQRSSKPSPFFRFIS